MDYIPVSEARTMPGLRLVLTAAVPGPWGESAKAIFAYKDIAYTPVYQQGGGPNEELQQWTGQNSAPVAVYEDEQPRSSWLDILLLAERLNPDKPLLPEDIELRALVIGLSRELAGERGLAWNRRLQMFAAMMQSGKPPEAVQRMAQKYGWSEAEHAAAGDRIASCLKYFATRLRMQQRLQSPYLVGGALTAVDIYLANFMGMLAPLGHADNPMPDYMRATYENVPTQLQDYVRPILLQHRDYMYQHYIQLPLDF